MAVDALGESVGVAEAKVNVIGRALELGNDNAARLQLAKSDPLYRSALMKRLVDPDLPGLLTQGESEAFQRAQTISRALTVTGSGSVLVPTAIGPSFIFTNNGAGPTSIRSVARNVAIVGSSWNGVTTAGVTASMDAEASEVSDDTPTVAQVTADLKTARAFVEFSIEAMQDQSALEGELQLALFDARFNLEEAEFASGTGAGNEVQGWITALDGSASEDTSPNTAEEFNIADVFDTQGALPTRHLMSPRVAWVLHPGIALDIRALTLAAGGAEGVWTDIAAGQPSLLNGIPVVYSDQAANSRTIDAAVTAANTAVATVGDWSRFVIVDHIAGATIELVPHVMGANQRPTGNRGIFMLWRFGAKVVDIDAFRMQSIPTTL